MDRRDIIVVGASAGGVEPMAELVTGLPADFGGVVLVVLHVPAGGETALPKILNRQSRLRTVLAEDGEPLRPGRVLVAPPGFHLVVEKQNVSLSNGARENGFRPAIDVLFRSAALAHGPRIVGVVLSGALDDGAAGMVSVRLRGGVGIVQDPDDALHSSMPQAAIDAAAVDHVVPAEQIADLLVKLAAEEVPSAPPAEPELMATETKMIAEGSTGVAVSEPPGNPAGLVCPACSGPLYEVSEGNLTRYRCRVGHAWSPLSLASEQGGAAENALWTAAETLEEKAILRERLADRARARGREAAARQLLRSAESARDAAGQVRRLIEDAADGESA